MFRAPLHSSGAGGPAPGVPPPSVISDHPQISLHLPGSLGSGALRVHLHGRLEGGRGAQGPHAHQAPTGRGLDRGRSAQKPLPFCPHLWGGWGGVGLEMVGGAKAFPTGKSLLVPTSCTSSSRPGILLLFPLLPPRLLLPPLPSHPSPSSRLLPQVVMESGYQDRPPAWNRGQGETNSAAR